MSSGHIKSTTPQTITCCASPGPVGSCSLDHPYVACCSLAHILRAFSVPEPFYESAEMYVTVN